MDSAAMKRLVVFILATLVLLAWAGLPASSASVLKTEAKPKGALDLTTAITRVAEETMRSVVYVEVTESRVVENPFREFESNPFFKHFFNLPKMPKKFKQEIKGLGSGMIIDAEGDILTNYHVAGEAAKMEVTLADGRKYPAKLVGGDAKTDLAVIRISGAGSLPHVTFGDSDAVRVGEWVVAIGAPRALEKSVTQGIVSALHRSGITNPSSYEDFLQTDAAINPGDSGGPLLNLYGQVIGVNAAIATESGGFEGIGFTIPSNIAVYVANALITHGKVVRGWLGVTIRSLTPELAKEARTESIAGALIVDIVKGGPAEKAGLKKNDVVIAWGDRNIADADALRNDVAATAVGSSVKVTILRDGKKEYATVVIGNQAEAAKFEAGVVMHRLGAEVRAPTQNEIDKYGLDENEGVVIEKLEPKGPLEEAGFEVGDMILAVEDEPVEGVDSFITLVSALPAGKKVSLTALDQRTGNTGTIFVMVR